VCLWWLRLGDGLPAASNHAGVLQPGDPGSGAVVALVQGPEGERGRAGSFAQAVGEIAAQIAAGGARLRPFAGARGLAGDERQRKQQERRDAGSVRYGRSDRGHGLEVDARIPAVKAVFSGRRDGARIDA
jgi:hypothetical protein